MSRLITSLHNPRIKRVGHLRSGRRRGREGRYLIDGARELRRAVASGAEFEEAFVCPDLCQSADSQWLLARLQELAIPVWRVTTAVFEKLAFGDRCDGVLAIGVTPDLTLTKLSLPETPLIALLVGVEKPGNVGAVLRSAAAAGVSAVVIVDASTDLFNPNCIRASLGTIFSVPLAIATSREALAWLRGLATPPAIFAARPNAQLLYTQVRLAAAAAIVLGSEAAGLSELWAAPDIFPVRIPMCGIADSLNVSATAAVLFYEALRQRTKSSANPRPSNC